jgi:putative redox protein
MPVVRWVEKRQFVGTDSTRHAIVISTPDVDNGTGVKPSDLLLLALGSCSAVDVVEILRKKRQALTGLLVRVEGEQDPDPPWAFRRITLTYEVRGRGLSRPAVEQAVALAEEKYCSVRATLDSRVAIQREIRIVEE